MVKQCSEVFEGLHPTKEIEILVINWAICQQNKGFDGFCQQNTESQQ
jgi:hypothetical protein